MQSFVQKVCIVLIIAFLSFITPEKGISQIQINSMYHITNMNNWELDDTYSMNQNQLGFSVGYGISPLTNIRWEIFPQVKASFGQLTNPNYAYDLNSFGINIQNKLYPLTFAEDCNCPDFKSNGNSIDKTFFALVDFGGMYDQITFAPEGTRVDDFTGYSFYVSAGIGLDIILSKKSILAPYIAYRLSTDINTDTSTIIKANPSGFDFGISYVHKIIRRRY